MMSQLPKLWNIRKILNPLMLGTKQVSALIYCSILLKQVLRKLFTVTDMANTSYTVTDLLNTSSTLIDTANTSDRYLLIIFKVSNRKILHTRCFRPRSFHSTDSHFCMTFASRSTHTHKLNPTLVFVPAKWHALHHFRRNTGLKIIKEHQNCGVLLEAGDKLTSNCSNIKWKQHKDDKDKTNYELAQSTWQQQQKVWNDKYNQLQLRRFNFNIKWNLMQYCLDQQ